jgi:hypothetical protein
MFGLTRAVTTLIGVATAVVLVWVAAQIGDDSTADYWALYSLVAAAGLVMAFSQLLGGWTKWGWPRLSGTVFLLGFLPALLVAGWVLGAGQPSENWLQQHVVDWSDDLGLGGVVEDLLDLAGPLAFLAGLTFGFTFDTTGPRRRDLVEPDERVERAAPTTRTEIREHDTPTEVANGDRETAVTRHAEEPTTSTTESTRR